jgi:hypothetical protein
MMIGIAEMNIEELKHRLSSVTDEKTADKTLRTLNAVQNDEYGENSADERFAKQRAQVEQAVKTASEAICPPPCDSISSEFWDTEAGQLLAEAQYWLYAPEYITIADAARLIYGAAETRNLVAIRDLIKRGVLTRYRRPDARFKYRRADTKTDRGSRNWLLRESEVRTHADRRNQK